FPPWDEDLAVRNSLAPGFSSRNQLQRCAHGAGHLRREFAKQVSGSGETKPDRGALSGVRSVVESRRKIAISHEPGSSRADKIRYRGHCMSRIGAIHKGERQRMRASHKEVVAAGRDITRIFVSDHAGCKTRSLKGHAFCKGIPIVSSECLRTLPPFRRVLRRSIAWRVRHANTGAERGSCEQAGIQIGFVQVVIKFLPDT